MRMCNGQQGKMFIECLSEFKRWKKITIDDQ